MLDITSLHVAFSSLWFKVSQHSIAYPKAFLCLKQSTQTVMLFYKNVPWIMSISLNDLLNRKRSCATLQHQLMLHQFIWVSNQPCWQDIVQTHPGKQLTVWVVLMVLPPIETVKLPQLFAGRSLRNLLSNKQMWSDLGSWFREANYSSNDCIVIHSVH